jgi:hypothetical protein
MKRAFLVTSSIALDPSRPFKGTVQRTVFSTEDRLAQTIFSLHNLSQIDPEADIILLDSSPQTFGELVLLKNEIPQLIYVQLEHMSPQVAETVRTHTNKSHCECLMLLEFFKHWKKRLRQYDFVTKICGRYIIHNDSYSVDLFKTGFRNKFFFKQHMDWGSELFNHMRDAYPPEMIANERLRGHYTVAHGFGIEKLDHYELLMALCCQFTDVGQKMYDLDVEYALYYFMELLGFNNDVLLAPWGVIGRCGVTGKEYTY